MNGKDIELSRRRVLGGIATVGAASAAAGAGTFALFSDTETSSGNTIQAGTLTLSDPTPESFSLTNIKPGWDNSDNPVTIETTYNSDSAINPADFTFTLSLENEDNDSASPTPESASSLGVSETAKKIRVNSAKVTDDSETTLYDLADITQETHELEDGNVDYVDLNMITGTNSGQTIEPGDTLTFTLELSVPTEVGNDLQGEGIDVSAEFYAEQPQP